MSPHKAQIKNDISNVVSGEKREALAQQDEVQLYMQAESPSIPTSKLKIDSSNKHFKVVAPSLTEPPDLVCLSHLRWDFVYQRPQHLLSRCAKERRVFFIEEPIFSSDSSGRLDIGRRESGVWVVVPHLKEGLSQSEVNTALQMLLGELFAERQIGQYIFWYYTPMAMAFTRHLKPLAIVYDCMDELSAFNGAPPAMRESEAELLKRADIVFTGGQSLYEAKRDRHPNVYAFPSSIEKAHFAQARNFTADPADQADIPHPRLGFFGVIDERMDIELLGGIAAARPDWHLVIIGPVVKIDPAILPRPQNIHYLGGKSYKELPAYLAGWDVAMLPFARNSSTRFISPTKTPEYLAAGKPVVSTSIRDVVRPYGENGLVRIADTVADFVAAAETALNENPHQSGWLLSVDTFLAQNSWDRTWDRMTELMQSAVTK
ncbi:glycosyltransferase family 1 protein [Argonema galeatum]|uniref:glycosyltransferase family 1 protein n=1 Tax=Argonema galeatum TaxID=2942762 RepID=UPI002013763E|nr:glycosyltransferase family 1 protein [Argonema galeatum]MCL1466406.1 glycosyltransferase family 1 protein [Argonema galeatum A003/A1]